MKARDVFAAVLGRFGAGQKLVMGALALAVLAIPAAASADCGNEAIRKAQDATHLPECRAFERVSPADKGGGDIVAEDESIVASKSGDGAIFVSRLQFGDAIGSGVVARTTYLARRGGGGWSSHSLTPTPQPELEQIFVGPTKVEVFSEDLSNALLWAYDLPASLDDTPERENFYSLDTATGSLRPISVSQEEPLLFFENFNQNVFGVSADAEHVAYVSLTRMLPEAPGPFVENVYRWDDGKLSLAGVLPDGTVPPNGSTSAFPSLSMRSQISEDGASLAFRASPDASSPPQLYLNVAGRGSTWISQPELSDPAQNSVPPSGVGFEGMTPDGKHVFFASDSPLLDGDTAPGPDLYRYTASTTPETDSNLTLITNEGTALNEPLGYGGALVGMSNDGEQVYIHHTSDLLKVWDRGVTSTISSDITRNPEPKEQLALTASQPGFGRVSPDGRWLTYIVRGLHMFLYDLQHDSLTCISCPGTASLVPHLTATGRLDDLAFRPRFLTPDGEVFFTSPGALVPEDTNGVADVYMYDGPKQELRLITSGKGRDPAEFSDASASGDDVFVVTRGRLVPSDRDEYVDLYDVRVGGGFDETERTVTRCSGEECQGAAGASPAAALGGTSKVRGAGNVKSRRCGRHRRSVTRGGRSRCVKKHNRAKRNRRASR